MKTEINKKRPGIAHFLRKRIKTISGFRSDFLWRSKLNSEQEGVDTITLAQGTARISLAKAGADWRFTTPMTATADAAAVDALLLARLAGIEGGRRALRVARHAAGGHPHRRLPRAAAPAAAGARRRRRPPWHAGPPPRPSVRLALISAREGAP